MVRLQTASRVGRQPKAAIALDESEQIGNMAVMASMFPPTDSLAQAIQEAPAWALVSLTMPDEQLRQDGAAELARWITQRINQPYQDARQLGLPL
jgi:hypothetical protein